LFVELPLSIASIVVLDLASAPFHSHSRAPPPSRIAVAKAVGVALSKLNASIKLDLPEPLGPIMTLSGPSSIGGLPGGNERNPSNRKDFKKCIYLLHFYAHANFGIWQFSLVLYIKQGNRTANGVVVRQKAVLFFVNGLLALSL
jgi:hypothetical protein